MKSGKITIGVSPRLRAELSDASDLRVRRLPEVIEELQAIADKLPARYGWRFKTADAFSAEASSPNLSIADLNALYWRDTLALAEAYSVMAVWRMVDICQSAVRAIEEENVVPSCILARSALESAVQFVHDARTVSATLDEICNVDLHNQIAVSSELEQILVRTVFSSRLTGTEEIYRSTNVLTVIDKIAKVAESGPIKRQYELLCELTHPSFLGRSTHLISAERGPRAGDELRVISPENGPTADEFRQLAFWALSWAIEGQASSFRLTQKSIRDFFEAFPLLKSRAATRR